MCNETSAISGCLNKLLDMTYFLLNMWDPAEKINYISQQTFNEKLSLYHSDLSRLLYTVKH